MWCKLQKAGLLETTYAEPFPGGCLSIFVVNSLNAATLSIVDVCHVLFIERMSFAGRCFLCNWNYERINYMV